MEPSVNQEVDELAAWTRDVKEPRLMQERNVVAAEAVGMAAPRADC